MTKKRRKKRHKRLYFTQVHEDAIVQYVLTKDPEVRTDLYIKYIGPAFNELVDKIIYTYKFTTLPNVEVLAEECKVWLTTILEKYDPNRGSKAFSYFSVITKNWFIHKIKKNSQQNRRETAYGDLSKELEKRHMSVHNPYNQMRQEKEFWALLWVEIDGWGMINMKPNEKKVYEAVRILLSSPDDIEIFNKKAIYLYMREITGLNTKQIVNSLNKMREKYKVFKKEWDEGKL